MKKLGFIIGSLMALTLTVPTLAPAASFRVSPIRVFLKARAKIASVTVINQGDEKLTLQLSAKSWSQDEQGQDKLEETRELVIFPKILTLEKGQERVVRLALRGPPATKRERTYRLFVEELPVTQPGITGLRVVLIISVPLFVQPLKELRQWNVETVVLDRGRARLDIRNTGNTHIQVKKSTVTGQDGDGAELFTQGTGGWYVLAGKSKAFYVSLPQAECLQARSLKVKVETGKGSKGGEFQVSPDPEKCARKTEERKETPETRQ